MNPYPNLRQVILLCLVVVPLVQFVLFPALAFLSARIGLIATQVGSLAILLFFVRFSRCRIEDLFLLNATSAAALLATVPAACGFALLAAECDLAVARLLSHLDVDLPLIVQRTLIEVQIVRSFGEAVTTFVAVVLLPGLYEELLFRGFVFVSLYAHFGAVRALLMSSLIFAVLHLSPAQLPAHFLIGLFLGAIVYWTHSIYPAVVAHMANNLVSVVGVNVRTYTGADVLGTAQSLPLPVLLAAVVLLWLGIRVLMRQRPLLPIIPREDWENSQQVSTA